LSEAQRNAQRLALENQDLHRRLDDLSMGVEELRDKLVDTQRIADARLQLAEELQAEVERLDSALRLSSGGDHDAFVRQLASENSALKAENRMLSDKVNLLLEEVDQPGYGGRSQRESTLSTRRDSRASSNNFESLQNELEDWHRRFVPSSNSNRPISDYDEPSRRTPTERLR
ncbi:Negative regulator of mitotic exit, partial [Tulasnella sp. 417]